jgi:TM2 domain-containing membrane protein YozV
MKFKALLTLAALGLCSSLEAANFWNVPDATPTPLAPPEIQEWGNTVDVVKPTETPVSAPMVQIATPTPTPLPGLSPKNPTQAALFSVVIPGSGQVYAGDPIKGIVFASLFGIGLWQTLDNLQLVYDSSGDLVAKNETAGNLFGLATLAVYGFGIQDAYNTAASYNKKNYLTFHLGITPRPNANLAYMF